MKHITAVAAIFIYLGIPIYFMASFAYAASFVYEWTMRDALGLSLGFRFFVGVMFFIGLCKMGLKENEVESKNVMWKLGGYALAPWLSLAVVWLLTK